MSNQISLSSYLFRRLHQLGVRSIHGVPSDYNLQALDYITPSGLHWVGNSNELNAGYAADGYARIRGISALFTGFGVGELSVINAIGGAYSEMAPVVHIVGTPPRMARDARLCVHHTLGDGNYRVFADMYRLVTVAQADLIDLDTATGLIDRTLRECVMQSRPVYIEIPTDMATALVSEEGLFTPIDLTSPVMDSAVEDSVSSQILERIYSAKQPLIIVDGFTSRYSYTEEAKQLTNVTGFPTVTTPFGKSIADETSPNFHGVYAGSAGDPKFMEWVQSCDLVLRLGPLDADTNTYGFTTITDRKVTIDFHGNSIEIIGTSTNDVSVKGILQKILQQFDSSKLSRSFITQSILPNPRSRIDDLQISDLNHPITQNKFWTRISSFFQSGDIILTEGGTSSSGGCEFILPPATTLITSGIWISIGYTLGACAGCSLALRDMTSENLRPNGRTILFIGDGSLQMSAQAIGDIIRNRLDVIIFVLNNDGYTVERLIHGMEESYNDIQPWRYLEGPSYFGAPKDDEGYPVTTCRVANWAELDDVVQDEKFKHGRGLKMVEVMMDKRDSPVTLKNLAAYVAKRNRKAESH